MPRSISMRRLLENCIAGMILTRDLSVPILFYRNNRCHCMKPLVQMIHAPTERAKRHRRYGTDWVDSPNPNARAPGQIDGRCVWKRYDIPILVQNGYTYPKRPILKNFQVNSYRSMWKGSRSTDSYRCLFLSPDREFFSEYLGVMTYINRERYVKIDVSNFISNFTGYRACSNTFRKFKFHRS